jgi:hypothetical protein
MSSFRHYQIRVTETGNPLKPQLELLNEDGQPFGASEMIEFNKSVDKMKRHESYRVRFSIENFDNCRLRFLPVSSGVDPQDSDLMWAHRQKSCPEDPCYMNDVIWVERAQHQGRWIEVVNRDKIVEDFWFTLNLCDKSQTSPTKADYIPLDPGGSNQNNGAPFIEFMAASCLTGAIVGFGTAALTNGQPLISAGPTAAVGGAIVGLIVGMVLERR